MKKLLFNVLMKSLTSFANHKFNAVNDDFDDDEDEDYDEIDKAESEYWKEQARIWDREHGDD